MAPLIMMRVIHGRIAPRTHNEEPVMWAWMCSSSSAWVSRRTNSRVAGDLGRPDLMWCHCNGFTAGNCQRVEPVKQRRAHHVTSNLPGLFCFYSGGFPSLGFSDAEIWCLLWYHPEQSTKEAVQQSSFRWSETTLRCWDATVLSSIFPTVSGSTLGTRIYRPMH